MCCTYRHANTQRKLKARPQRTAGYQRRQQQKSASRDRRRPRRSDGSRPDVRRADRSTRGSEVLGQLLWCRGFQPRLCVTNRSSGGTVRCTVRELQRERGVAWRGADAECYCLRGAGSSRQRSSMHASCSREGQVLLGAPSSQSLHMPPTATAVSETTRPQGF